uniref:Nucleoporin NDC1 n=1 Tax=Astyanax mexicanus TaxID=7994 RepID=A0A8B9KND2_ASTMX
AFLIELNCDVVRWRALASIAWSVLLLPATTTLFVFLVRFSLFHPVEWISECFGLLTAASTIFSLILLCGVVLVIGFFNLEGYTVVPSIPCSRVALLAKVLHPRQCVHSLVHCTVGMMVMWCASVMAGGRYQALGSPCTRGESADAPEVCLNEYHLFLLLAGAFIGYSHSFLGVVQNMNYVSFQIIQQYKYLRCKGSLPWVLKCSAVQSLYAVRNYVALYFFFGHIPRAWISNSLNLPIDRAWQNNVHCFLYCFWLLTGAKGLKLFFFFFVFDVRNNAISLTLFLALFLCLCVSVCFSVSSAVVSGTEDLPQTPRPSVLLKTPGSVFLKSSGRGISSPLTAPFTPDLDSPFSTPSLRHLAAQQVPQQGQWLGSVQSPHIIRRGPKLWSTSTDSQANGSALASPVPTPSSPPPEQKSSFMAQWLQNRKEQVKGFMAKRVLVVYLFNKLPEASSQALFADSQAHIWALEGLSHLVAASFSEDKYGVVQTTLPSILGCMLSLQEAVDRHFKLPHASSKPVKTSCSMGDSTYKTLRFALRAALKTSIYRITSTFGEHLNAVCISAEHQKRLQQFMEYRE